MKYKFIGFQEQADGSYVAYYNIVWPRTHPRWDSTVVLKPKEENKT